MKFVSKRCFIKIPSEISLLYDKKNNLLLIKTKTNQKLVRLNVKLLILKEKNLILITNVIINNVTKKIKKTVQKLTISTINQAVSDVLLVNYKKLKLVGVGYKVFCDQNNLNQNFLNLKLGYSHSIYYKIPSNIKINIHQSVKLFLSSYCKFNLSQSASMIRSLKKPEPYKGKGILYSNEKIKLKEGKKV